MKTRLLAKYAGLLISGLLILLGSTSVLADAGDTISNIATITYDVGGAAQTPIESSPTGNTTPGVGNGASTVFVEDRLVNFTVTNVDVGLIETGAGSTAQMTTFSIASISAGATTTDSNGELDFRLTAVNRANTTADPFGGPDNDNFDTTGLTVIVDANANDVYDAGVDTANFIDQLAPGDSVTVFVLGDIPAGQADGDVAVVSLVATAAEALTATDGTGVLDTGNLGADLVANTGADVVGQIDNTFIDAAGDVATDGASPDNTGDGFHSDSGGYVVNLANLTVTKTSAVIDDPVNGAVNPKAIPGATIEYTVTIANGAGAGTADNVTITDDLNTQIAVDSTLAWVAGSMAITAPTVNGGATQSLTDAPGDDEGEFNNPSVNTVIARCGTLLAGETCTLTFQVTMQ